VEGVLEIGGGDDDGLDVFVFIKLFIVTGERDLLAGEFVDVGGTFIAAATPDVGEGDEFEIESGRGFEERGNEAAAAAVGKAYNSDADAVVRSEYSGITGSGNRCGGDSGSGEFEKIAAGRIFCGHTTSSGLGEAK
jgi:hypothetical protein